MFAPFHRLALAALALLCLAMPLTSAAVTVLGVTLGAATPDEVRAMIREYGGTVLDQASQSLTGGPMIKAGGSLGLEGLQETLFLFDAQDRLVAVHMTLPKDRYDAILASLRGKYRYVGGRRPFVGDADATLRAEDVEIRLEAPHLSFEMSATYGTDAFWRMFEAYLERKARARRQAQDQRL